MFSRRRYNAFYNVDTRVNLSTATGINTAAGPFMSAIVLRGRLSDGRWKKYGRRYLSRQYFCLLIDVSRLLFSNNDWSILDPI